MMSYYNQQFAQLSKPNSTTKVKLVGEDQETNWLDLNQDCITALREFLDILEAEISN